MRIYTAIDDMPPPGRVWIRGLAGYLVTAGTPVQALYLASAQNVALTGTAISTIDAGLSLSEAHAMLTDGLTKAELVALGADLGLSLSETSLKAELLDAIQTHLEGLAP